MLHVAWPDRSTYVRGLTPGNRAYLAWFTMEVHLKRAADGSWRFDREGRAMVGN